MASEGGGKIRNKRGASSSKPYERRKSLFRRITDSIKDVLRPSWLASGEGSGDEPEGDEQVVNPAQVSSQRPGQGRMEGNVPRANPSSSTANTTIAWQQTPAGLRNFEGQGQSGASRMPTWGNSSYSTFDKNYFVQKHSADARKSDGLPDMSRKSEGLPDMSGVGLGGLPLQQPSPSSSSTSAASSATAASGRRKLRLSESEAQSPSASFSARQQAGGASPMSEESQSATSQSDDNPAKRQRLWSPEMSRRGRSFQMTPQNKPAFKISVFCESSSLNQSLHESPFYSGKTTYGGASAYRRSSLNSSLPYSTSLPIRKPVTPKPLNNSGNAVLSSSANQILKTLERLADSKRSTTVNETDSESLLSFTPRSYRKPSRPLQTSLPSRSLNVSIVGPPLSGLNMPTPVRIQQNRQVVSLPAQRSVPSATITRPLHEEQEDEDIQEIEEPRAGPSRQMDRGPPGQGSGKMKHPKSYDTRKKAGRPEDEEVPEVPNLRTDFTLPIASMPDMGFKFGLPAPAAAANVQSSANAKPNPQSSTTVKPNPQSSTTVKPAASSMDSVYWPTAVRQSYMTGVSSVSSQSASRLQFTFSSPIIKTAPEVSGSSAASVPSPSSSMDFQFSSPLKLGQSIPSSSAQTSVAYSQGTPSSSAGFTATYSATGATMTSGGAYSQGTPSSSAGFTATYSASGTTMTSGGGAISSTTPFTPFTPPAWGSTAPKPKANVSGNSISGFGKKSVPTSPAESPVAGGSFKPSPQLKSGSVMDVLGGGGNSAGTSPSSSTSSSSFQAASSLKQGSVMDILGGGKASSPASSSTPAAPSGSDSLFAKFAPAAGSWECDACMVQNKPEAARCVACETPKPGAKKAEKPSGSSSTTGESLFAKFAPAAGTWDCDVCLVQNKAEAMKCVACETAKPGTKTAASSSTSGDSLFAKFAPAAGSWDCDACLLQNKGDATKCVACETARPGTAKPAAPPAQDSLMAKFKQPEGSWECDVCMVQNTATQTKCLACESPRPGAQATGSMPPSMFGGSSTIGQIGSGGGLVLGNLSSSSSASPFLSATSTTKDSSATGFAGFGTSAASTTGFTFGAGSAGAKDSSATGTAASGGFKFGGQDTSNSNSASTPTPGSTFGAKSSADTNGPSATKSDVGGFKFGAPTPATTAQAEVGGFKFGAPTPASSTATQAEVGGFKFGAATPASSTTAPAGSGFSFGHTSSGTTATVAAVSISAPSFSFGAGGGQSGSAIVGESTAKSSDALTKGTSEASSESATPFSFNPVFGSGKPSNSLPLGAAPSLSSGQAGSLSTAGGFAFKPSALENAAPPQAGLSKPGALPGGFSFGASSQASSDGASKPSSFSASDALAKNGSIGNASQPSTTGFAFGTPSTSKPFSFGAPTTGAPAKPAVNGEVGGNGVFAFGAPPAQPTMSAPTAGFNFSAPSKDSGAGNNNNKPSFAFGGETGGQAGEKRRLDNDVGPTDAKKPFGMQSGNSASGAFKFGAPDDSSAKPAASVFGGQTSSFGSTAPSGFPFGAGAQANPASSSVFGAGGAGSSGGEATTSRPSVFSFGSGSQGNAAAAAPFGSEAPAPGAGFNFQMNKQFNFGTGSSTTPGQPFQFSAPPVADLTSAQASSAPGVYMFGGPGGSAPQPSDPAQFNVGAGGAGGGESRKIKRAVRRTARK